MHQSSKVAKAIVGLDLGDTTSNLCVLNPDDGQVIEETRLKTNPASLRTYFEQRQGTLVALETGTHSPWVSRLLQDCGHKPLVANARKVRLIHADQRKNDKLDAEKLARLARYDPNLLAPIRHRGEQAQANLAALRGRGALVQARTGLINHVRGAVKSFGARIPKLSATTFPKRVLQHLPERLRPALCPVVSVIAELNNQIRAFDRLIEQLSNEAHPETRLLRQVRGVGAVTALTFVLTLDDPTRFKDSRAVGAYLGLTPGQHQSGQREVRQHISKQGDVMLRHLLVQSAHYLLGPFGEDCDLRRYGLTIIAKGGGYGKRRAVVAVARKLAVLLHHLWVTAEVYDPLYNAKRAQGRPASP